MNYSTAIFLISDSVRGVLCAYEAHDDAPLTFYKTLDPNIKFDDYVVVPSDTRHKMAICKVVQTDVEPDFDVRGEVKWIIGTIDRADHEALLKQESDAIDKIRSAEKRKKREEMRDALMADAGADLRKLPIYHQTLGKDSKPDDSK